MSDSELGLHTGRSYEEVLEQRQDDEGYKTATTNEQVGRSLYKITQNKYTYLFHQIYYSLASYTFFNAIILY